ncbi:MAG: UDP-N-acetylmuramoyl-L-alanyl-D-glutamate--2,6-diaminopimelate ligase [Syntrophothermus sp.]
MELVQLLNSVNAIQVMGEVQRKDVSAIVYDSRKVIKSSVFVAIKGEKFDGHKFILDAINSGAIAVVLEDNEVIPDEIFIHRSVAKILVKDSRIALAELSRGFYKDPTSNLKLVGITGTNGKTTTSFFVKNIIETAGRKTGLLGTIVNMIADKKIDARLTTPESNDLNNLLMEMINDGCEYAVMEVSSHSLVQKRVYGLDYKAAVFTNLTVDHLDFHLTLENYFSAKKILFDNLSDDAVALYNTDDSYGKEIVKDTRAKVFSYGKSEDADFFLSNIKFDLDGTRFNITYNGNTYKLSTRLIGEFNAYNAAAAFATGILIGFDVEDVIKGIESTKQVPGRFEVVGNRKKAIIDYSHTPDSLEKALITLKGIVDSKKPIYTVFGCGGNRDKTKRPVMGKIATQLSTKAYVTSDNPRNEDPFAIIDDIVKGISAKNYEIIENREEAIRKAIITSEDDAVILIAGKGHEEYQDVKGVRSHFSDKEMALKYL